MMTLDDAGSWYNSDRVNLYRMKRIGMKHWDHASLEHSSIWTDDKFKEINGKEIERGAGEALEPIDDLGILVLFSVFEASVREHLEGLVRPQIARIEDSILRKACEEELEGVRQGSFKNNVLEPLKSRRPKLQDLTEQVDQVRRYRNGVAHGRREQKLGDLSLSPKQVYERLKKYLETLGISAASERIAPLPLKPYYFLNDGFREISVNFAPCVCGR